MATGSITSVNNKEFLAISFSGRWLVEGASPGVEQLKSILPSGDIKEIRFDSAKLEAWDTALVMMVVAIYRHFENCDVVIHSDGLPEGANRLVHLALAVGEREGARKTKQRKGFLIVVGEQVLDLVANAKSLVEFSGSIFISVVRFLKGNAVYRNSDLMNYIHEAGIAGLPIVSLISLLLGMIFAFVGIMQLKLFGAGIYTADLVAIAMVRELAPIMTAIVVAGRTGAAYAAELGTMKVNEEIDALTTLGIEPIDFLVTPRFVALVLMMPLLTIYASLFGIIGGTGVSLIMLDVSFGQYLTQTIQSLSLNSFFSGLFKATVYGSLVAIAGCFHGMMCGNSALAVGRSTTQAVVSSIVLVVISAALLTVIYINLGI